MVFQILFIGVFLAVYAGMHYFVFLNISNLTNLTRGNWFYILIVLMVAAFPLATYLEKTVNSLFTRAFYWASSVWLGFLFFMFCVTLIYKMFLLILDVNPSLSLAFIVLIPLILSIYALAHAQNVVVKEVSVPVKGLDRELRVVQISDLHLGTINQMPFLENVVQRVNSLKPDFVVITGDLVDGSASLTRELLESLNYLNAKTFFVTGNHEVYEGVDNVLPLIEKTDIVVLRNSVFNFKGLNIVGIDYVDGKKNLIRQLDKMNLLPSKPNILLYHSPSVKADVLEKYNISLQLAGHTHGGQIFPFHFLSRIGNAYIYGLHTSKNGSSRVYVSGGTGTWGPPMRLGSDSEITLLTLKKGLT